MRQAASLLITGNLKDLCAKCRVLIAVYFAHPAFQPVQQFLHSLKL